MPTALAVSGDPNDEALEAMEGWAPAFRRFTEARDWLRAALGDGGGDAPLPPPPGGDILRHQGAGGMRRRAAARGGPTARINV